MQIFLAGGSGVIGTRLIPALIAAGHTVTATTRREENAQRLRDLGAVPAIVDVYDADRLAQAVADAAPDAIIHQLTDLSDYDTDANARLRRVGTANLVAAARAAGVERMLVQSIAWAFVPGDEPAAAETPVQPGSAVEEMESLVLSLPHGTVLRYGMLYGPGTWYAPGGRIAEAVRAGLVPATDAITSFLRIEDAVQAAVAALDWPDGVYNIVDDEPAAGAEWLPVYAAGLGAPAPAVQSLPAGAPRGRAVLNTKARAAGWNPRFPSWRNGFPGNEQS